MIDRFMAHRLDPGIKRYLKRHFPGEAASIRRKAKELYPELKSKAPDIGGRENTQSINLDMFITMVSYYEASDHRMAGEAIDEIIADVFSHMQILHFCLNINVPFIFRVVKNAIYNDYRAYRVKVKEKVQKGKWNDTWEVIVGPREPEGLSLTYLGCPIVNYAKKNGYEELVPHACAVDEAYAKLIHSKLIRTQMISQGADYCDSWFVPDKSDIAKNHI